MKKLAIGSRDSSTHPTTNRETLDGARTTLWLISVMALLLSFGCSDEAGMTTCRDNGQCVNGTRCVDGVCLQSPLDASADQTLDGADGVDLHDVAGDAPRDDAEMPSDTSPDMEIEDTTGCANCLVAQTCCGDRCVDLQESATHCGACGVSCLGLAQVAASSCQAGVCVVDACHSGWGDCDGDNPNGCETPLNHPDHCSSCANACGVGEGCVGGLCACGTASSSAAVCPANQVCCDGACVAAESPTCTCAPGCGAGEECCGGVCIEVSTDASNCGACAAPCAQGETCVAGVCACTVGSLGDDQNCGACGQACAASTHCIEGRCACSGGGLVGDDNNCSACGVACGSAESCVANACVCSTGQLNDDSNCGACGAVCGPTQSCMARNAAFVCQCGSGTSECGNGACADLTADPANCGTCAKVCPASSTEDAVCSGGQCFKQCKANRGNCDGFDFNGCEVSLSDSGSCGVTCETSVGCGWNETCSTAPLNHCHCDDGNDCNPGERCVSAIDGVDHCECGLGFACAAGQFCCSEFFGRTCADVMTDSTNCGDCGRQCSNGQSCVSGVCQ